MTRFEHGTRMCYQAGCRRDECKQAEAAYKRELRKKQREAVGEFAGAPVSALSLVSSGGTVTSTSANGSEFSVVAGVRAEIEQFGGAKRPALANAALALAEVLDNPKAVSTKPAAAAKLADLLEQMRKSADVKESPLARVRQMTKPQVKTG